MPGPSPTPLILTEKLRSLLNGIVRRPTSPQGRVQRCQIVLLSDGGLSNAAIAHRLGIERRSVRRWRDRFARSLPRLQEIETAALREGMEGMDPLQIDRLLVKGIEEALSDAPRPGTPATFTPEQLVQIVALACDPPEESGRPVSHWTPKELADEAIKRQIVTSISPQSVGRFLKGGRSQAAPEPILAQPRHRR